MKMSYLAVLVVLRREKQFSAIRKVQTEAEDNFSGPL